MNKGRKISIILNDNTRINGVCELVEPYGVHIIPFSSNVESIIPMHRIIKVDYAPPTLSTQEWLRLYDNEEVAQDTAVIGDQVPVEHVPGGLFQKRLLEIEMIQEAEKLPYVEPSSSVQGYPVMPLHKLIEDGAARVALLRWLYHLEGVTYADTAHAK